MTSDTTAPAARTDTKQRMIRTTGRLLREQGYAATGLNQIVAEADAPKGSLYFHFPGGKEELAAAAVDRFAAAIGRRLTEGLASQPTVADAVAQFLDAYVEHLSSTQFQEGCAVAVIATEAQPDQELLVASVTRALSGWVDEFAAALEAEGRSPEQARQIATLVMAAIEGAIVMAKGMRSTQPLEGTRDALVPMLRA